MLKRIIFLTILLVSFNALAKSPTSSIGHSTQDIQPILVSESCESHYQDSKNSLACEGLDHDACILKTVAQWSPRSQCARDLRDSGKVAGMPVPCRHLNVPQTVLNKCIEKYVRGEVPVTRTTTAVN